MKDIILLLCCLKKITNFYIYFDGGHNFPTTLNECKNSFSLKKHTVSFFCTYFTLRYIVFIVKITH